MADIACLEGGAETIVQVQVKDLHIDDAESEDESSPVVDNGGALEEDADVDAGRVDAALCDSGPVRLAVE